MSRYDSLYPMYSREDCDCRARPKPVPCGCMPVRRPEPYPCREESSIKVKVFDDCSRCRDEHQLITAANPVTITNPWNCREKVLVTLGIDECGNLVVCIKR